MEKSNRCSVCGRIIPAHLGECVYCKRDKDEVAKVVHLARVEEPEKRKWVPWFFGGLGLVLVIWAIRSFLHFVDYLLKQGK